MPMNNEQIENSLEKQVIGIFKSDPSVKLISACTQGEEEGYLALNLRLGDKHKCPILESMTDSHLFAFLRMQHENDETCYTVMQSDGDEGDTITIDQCETLGFIETVRAKLSEHLDYPICSTIVEYGMDSVEIEFLMDIRTQ